MPEQLNIPETTNRKEIYVTLLPQIEALVASETNLIANLANIAGALKEAFGFFWVGFYLVDGDELVLGPFQGPIACTRISKGKGVCGNAWASNSIVIVPDVDKYPGHIACSSASRSEIAVAIDNASEKVSVVLDIDSDQLNDFSETDVHYLDILATIIRTKL